MRPTSKRRARLGLVGLVLVLSFVPAGAGAAARQTVVPGRYIVVYGGGISKASAETTGRERALGFRVDFSYTRALKGFSARLNADQVAKLRADPRVALVSPVRRVHADVALPLVHGERIPPRGVRRVLAATPTTVRQNSGVNVAVIDTGIDLFHPDLNATPGPNCVRPGSAPVDDNGHGTHVAGTIAAKNNGLGVTGIAPGTNVYAVKVLDASGQGTDAQVICGIDWVAANAASKNIRVANMSLGGDANPEAGRTCKTTLDPERRAICNARARGVTFVVAAGNNGQEFDGGDNGMSPAQYPEVLTVTAVADTDGKPGHLGRPCEGETDDSVASFSNFASTPTGVGHTLAAPGVCIYSTTNGGRYTTLSGTSMATPHVAGAVALCINEGGASGPCAGKTPGQIIQYLRADAQSYNSAHPGFGFAGDPRHHPAAGVYYGNLASVR